MIERARGPLLLGLLAALCLTAALWMGLDTVRTRRASGMWQTTSHAPGCARDPGWMDRAERALVAEPFHAEVLHALDPGQHQRCDLYRGYLVVPERARLTLELHAAGEARVMLGKRELVRFDSGTVRITRRGERVLEPGTHFLEARTSQAGGLAYLRLSARLEPVESATEVPMESRALWPLEHDSVAPSTFDGERARRDEHGPRRSGVRLTAMLSLAFGALLLALAARGARSSRTRLPLALEALLVGALAAAVLSAFGAAQADPHFITHGARAWRTLWLGLPTRSFVDAIPALGAPEWILGAAWALGGGEGPRIAAAALPTLEVLLLASAARSLGDRRTAVGVAVLTTAAVLSRGPLVIDRSSVPALAVALAALLLAQMIRGPGRRAVGRVGRALDGLGTDGSAAALAHTRATRARSALSFLALAALGSLATLALGAPPGALVPLVAASAGLALAQVRASDGLPPSPVR